MFYLSDMLRQDLHYFASDTGCDLEGIEVAVVGPEAGALYESTLRAAFGFLRRCDDGRYSSRTKMRVLNAAEAAERARTEGHPIPSEQLPGVITLSKPFGYDEETEVKSGGLTAALVVWAEDNGRTMLAVHRDARRQRQASFMVTLARAVGVGAFTAWVHSRNATGQQFLLAAGFAPSTMNASGGVAYTWGRTVTEDGVEDGIDPMDLMAVAAPRRSNYEESTPERYYDDDDPEF